MKILVADDHTLFREGITHVLSRLDETMDVLHASYCDEVLSLAADHPDLDLVLLDLNMPGTGGIDILEKLIQRFPALPVVILSASTLRGDMERALQLGAMGYINKSASSEVMLNALRIVLNGEVYVPSGVLKAAGDVEEKTTSITLTERQLQVLALLVKGYANKKIAGSLNLAEATVKMHVTAIFRQLNVTNRTQAAMAVEKMGVPLPPDNEGVN